MARHVFALAAMVLSLAAPVGAQPTPQPTPRGNAPGLQPRDPAQQQPPATGTVAASGVVSSPPTPARRSAERWCGSALPNCARRAPRALIRQGRYEFRDLPAGRFSVTASERRLRDAELRADQAVRARTAAPAARQPDCAEDRLRAAAQVDRHQPRDRRVTAIRSPTCRSRRCGCSSPRRGGGRCPPPADW